MLEIFPVVAVEGNEDEQHDGEGPHRGTSVADERQRDTDYRHKADCHAYVDEQVHEDTAGHTIAINTGEGLSTSFRVFYYTPHQEYIEQYDN